LHVLLLFAAVVDGYTLSSVRKKTHKQNIYLPQEMFFGMKWRLVLTLAAAVPVAIADTIAADDGDTIIFFPRAPNPDDVTSGDSVIARQLDGEMRCIL
jgi:hypothetical protein